MSHYKLLLRLLTTRDTIWLNDDVLDRSNRTCQISSGAVAWLQHKPFYCAVPMSFYGISVKYNGPLQALIAVIDDDRYDMVE